MRRLLTIAAAACAAALLTMPAARASDAKGDFAIRGIGAQSCKQLIEALQKKDATTGLSTAEWLMGYLTAINLMTPDTFDAVPVVDAPPLVSLVVGNCEKTQDARIADVVNGVMKAFAPAKIKSSSPVVQAREGDSLVEIRAATLAAMQSRLVDLGYFKGKPNGAFNSATGAALRAYQKDQKLPVTGLPEAETLVRLLIEHPKKKKG
jgi:hypothetical protein